MPQESEHQTRKQRIDARLTASSPPWTIIPYQDGLDTARLHGVAALFVLGDRIEARYAEAIAHAARLIQSGLAKAFRDDLVPQGPADEPAKVQLVRITNQRSMSKRGMHHAR